MGVEPFTAAFVGAGVKALGDVGKVASGLEKITTWILIQPEAAAAELAVIIGEVMKAPDVVNLAVDALFGVITEAKLNLVALARVGDGSLVRKVEDQRPHCHRISAIAARHLWQWLNKSGDNSPSADELRRALNGLDKGDQDFFEELTSFAKHVQNVAGRAAELAMKNQEVEGLALLTRVAPDLFAARKQANTLALRLTEMRTKFQRRALGLPPE
jgi:hypothetical protein